MRKPSLWVPVLGVAAVLTVGLWWMLEKRPQAAAMKPGNGRATPAVAAAGPVPNDAGMTAGLPAGEVKPAGPGKQTALRLVLAGDKVELLAREELQGDFHQRRGRLAWLPGMLLCRALDAQQRVLAEETLAAPDHACVVMEPQAAAADGMPAATAFSSPAPVVFQVRLPNVETATQLQVYRLTGPRPDDAGAAPAGKLLGCIALKP